MNSAKFHHQWLPEMVFVEKFLRKHFENFRTKNYKFENVAELGRTEMIVIDENGNATAVADSRGDDSVAVE